MRMRRRMIGISAALAGAVALSGVAGSAAAAGPVVPAGKATACSTDITGRGPGAAAGRHMEFSYTLAGGACRNAVYALIVRNTYDRKQLAIYLQLGDGLSKSISYAVDLPFTPTQPSDTGPGLVPGEAGLCVTAFTLRGFHIRDIAPDRSPTVEDTNLLTAVCDPLKGGTARAFH